MVIPGVGFDVVPSDTLARSLADRLADAASLEMAFFSDGAGSAGSAKTVMGMMADRVLSGPIAGGCYTPTQAFGTHLAFEIPGTVLKWRDSRTNNV